MKKKTTLRIIRWVILLSILVLTTVMGRLHQIIKLYPPIDAFCPFGGLESLWTLLRYQVLLKKIAWSSFILLFTTIGTAVLFRRSFCGNICPLGFLQELFGLGGRRIFKNRFNLPVKVDSVLRYLKYVVLVLFLALSWKTMSLIIQPYDPWVAYHHIGSDELFTKYLIGSLVLFGSLLLGIFVERPFCRYLCPMGGFLSIISKIGLTRIKRNSDSCIDCGICDYSCPMGLKISDKDETKSIECISCSECVNTCPVPDTLYYSTPKKIKKKIPVALLLLGTIFIFVAVLGITSVTKKFVWKTDTGLENRVERLLWGPHRIKEDNQMVDIVQIYQIHPTYIAQQFNFESDDDFYKTLNEMGIDVDDVVKMINDLYTEAGRDPTQLLGGGGGGGGCGGDDH